MKFRHTNAVVLIIDDIDADGPSVTFHATEEEAEAHARAEYSNAPSTDEDGGNTYAEGETANAAIYIARVLRKTVL